MSQIVQRFRLWLGVLLVRAYGFRVVPETPASLLPSRVEAIRERIRRSGHLNRCYNVRRTLENDVAEISRQVERLQGVGQGEKP